MLFGATFEKIPFFALLKQPLFKYVTDTIIIMSANFRHREAQFRSKSGDFSGASSCLKDALRLLQDVAGEGIEVGQRDAFAKTLSESRDKMDKKAKKRGEVNNNDDTTSAECNQGAVEFAVRHTAEAGRHAVAAPVGGGKGVVACGSVVLAEDPAAWLLNPDSAADALDHCAHCFSPCRQSLLPCPGCSAAVFCSRQCRRQAEVYHR